MGTGLLAIDAPACTHISINHHWGCKQHAYMYTMQMYWQCVASWPGLGKQCVAKQGKKGGVGAGEY